MAAGLSVLRHLFANSVELAEVYPSGTRFTPIGTDGDVLKVLVEVPDGTDTVERVAQRIAIAHAEARPFGHGESPSWYKAPF